MKLLVAATLGLAAVCTFSSADAQTRDRTVIVHKEVHHRGPAVKKVIIRHDEGMHRGWEHSRHRGATVVRKKVVVHD